jgi:hypothetical protein
MHGYALMWMVQSCSCKGISDLIYILSVVVYPENLDFWGIFRFYRIESEKYIWGRFLGCRADFLEGLRFEFESADNFSEVATIFR